MKYSLILSAAAAFALSACDRPTVVNPPPTSTVAVPVPVPGPAGPQGEPGKPADPASTNVIVVQPAASQSTN